MPPTLQYDKHQEKTYLIFIFWNLFNGYLNLNFINLVVQIIIVHWYRIMLFFSESFHIQTIASKIQLVPNFTKKYFKK